MALSRRTLSRSGWLRPARTSGPWTTSSSTRAVGSCCSSNGTRVFPLAEDALDDSLRPRLEHHGADLTLIESLDAVGQTDGPDANWSSVDGETEALRWPSTWDKAPVNLDKPAV